jgi:hypothetical protein
VVAVRVDARVGSVGGTVAVGAVGALRGVVVVVGLVAVDGLLDLVDDARHVDGLW